MFIIISYDISEDKKRQKLHKILSNYGIAVQLSVFEFELSNKQFIELKNQIDSITDCNNDNIRIYHLCSLCNEKAITFNKTGLNQKLKTIII